MSYARLPVGRLFVLLLGGFLAAVPTRAQSEQALDRTVRVSGEGTSAAAPDQAIVRFGVVTRAHAAEEARSRNAEASTNAMNAVRDVGIPESNLRMEGLRLQPRREYDPDADTWEEKGYEATRQVVVELDSLTLLPRLVAQAVQSGANRLEDVRYDLSDRSAIRDEALRRAARNARDKARLLAESLDAQLGPVRQITEQTFSFHRPSQRVQVEAAGMTRDQAAPEPDAYAGGDIEVEAQVETIFDLVVPE